MTWFLYLVSIVLVVVGAVSILYTDSVRKSMREMVAKKYFRLLGLVPLILGILLIISAGWSEVFWLVFLLGVVALAKGFFLLFSSKARIDTAITWTLDTASDQVYRFSAVICLVLGMALISWVR